MFANLQLDLRDIITIVAIILGPILAVQVQKFIEKAREKRRRRMALFQTLMATRAERLNREHVKALNMIDIEFYGRMIPFIKTRYQRRKEQAVTHAWKSYNSHLNHKDEYQSLEQWVKKSDELFTEMIYAIAQSLNYDYDKVQLQRDCYRPIAHGNLENTRLELLTGLEQVINKGKPLPMYVVNLPTGEAHKPKGEVKEIESKDSSAKNLGVQNEEDSSSSTDEHNIAVQRDSKGRGKKKNNALT